MLYIKTKGYVSLVWESSRDEWHEGWEINFCGEGDWWQVYGFIPFLKPVVLDENFLFLQKL